MGKGLTLESLLPGTKPAEKPQPRTAPRTFSPGGKKRRTTLMSENIAVGADEIREAHLKTAVFPSEKTALERMAQTVHGQSVSDLLREYLLSEYDKASREGKI